MCWLGLWGGYGLADAQSRPENADGERAIDRSSPSPTALQEPGEVLARAYCTGCHLFPEPDLLDRRTWAGGALRKMAPLLGVARLNLDNRPDGEILKEAKLFPEAPLLSEQDWIAICNYYLKTAPETPLPQEKRAPIEPSLNRFRVERILSPHAAPAVTLAACDGKAGGFFLGDARNRAVHRFDAQGHWLKTSPAPSSPVSIRWQEDHAYLTLIGDVFPSDLKSGRLMRLDAAMSGVQEIILSDLQRPVDCLPHDLNGDGLLDLVVAQFGNYMGRFSWFEGRADGTYKENVLLPHPGAVRAVITDSNHDGHPDLLVLMAQAREGVYLFENRGGGAFEMRQLLEFPPIYGSTYFELTDLDRDGAPDLVITQGDNGEYPSPFKRYHGIRIFLNDGNFHFNEARFYPLNGAFKALARDYDQDGDCDIAVISFFPDYEKSPEESFVYLENLGNLEFKAQSFPESIEGRWLTMDAGDVDLDGDFDLLLGSFIDGPKATPIPAWIEARWTAQGMAAVLLRNSTRPNPAGLK